MMAVDTPAPVDLGKYIETRLFGERPHLRGRRVPVAIVAYNHRTNGWTLAETAYNFTVSEAEVLAALLYYDEHREAIDAQEREAVRQFEEMADQHGSR
jgi:uncharacterized protein (DUF433 family)